MSFLRVVPVLILFVVLLIGIPGLGPAQSADGPPRGKLPTGAAPVSYALDLEVVPQRDRFSGTVRIHVRLDAATDRIWLHGRGLDVAETVATAADGVTVPALYTESGTTGVSRVDLVSPVGPGTVVLEFRYSAPFDRSLEGLYKVSRDGEDYIYTQFQPLSARLAFPGFDEPRFKTTFDISLTVPRDAAAVSNAPVRGETDLGDGRKRVAFDTTAPMPTYLVAMAVGAFDVVEWDPIPPNAVRDRPVPLRGFAAKGQGDRLSYALENTAGLLTVIEDYFGTPYPFEKLDIVAAAGFKAGGMENVAAIFYRESAVLLDESPSVRQKRYYAYIHAHELAHMWFGNLVTPAWWDDLWLNESFATWMSDRAVKTWKPAEYDDRGGVRRGNWAKWTDRLVSTRQIRQPIESDHDIASAFDSITYSKGGSVLAMVERYVSPDLFQDGVRRFMAKHRHGVARSEDFFTALSEAARDPGVLRAFKTFLEQPGTPEVTARWTCETGEEVVVRLQQSRSLPLGSTGNRGRLWALPLCLSYGGAQEEGAQCLLMEQASTTITLDTPRCPAWVLPNSGGGAYLNFDIGPEGWVSLVERLDRLPAAEALATVSSLHAAYESGAIDTETVLKASALAARSPHWDVASAPMQVLRNIKNFVLPRSERDAFKLVMQEIYRPALARFDTSPAGLRRAEDRTDLAMLRGDLIWFMALDAEEPALRSRLAGLASDYLGNGGGGEVQPGAIHPDLLRIALKTAAADGGVPALRRLAAVMRETDDPELRSHAIRALAWQTDPVLASWVRDLIMDPETSPFHASQLLRFQGRRADNSKAILDWLTDHYDSYAARIPRSHIAWLPWRVSGLCDRADRDRAAAFFETRVQDHRGGPRALANVLEAIDICIATSAGQRDSALLALSRRP